MQKENNMEAIALERQNKVWASVSTAVLIGLLLLLIFFITIKAPNPPFEASNTPGPEMTLETNFGITNEGMGDNFQPDKNNVISPPTPQDDKVITDDSPDNNVHVKSDPKNPDKDHPKDPQPDKNLQNALNNFKDTKGGDGTTNTPGDQGDPNGGDSHNYDGNSDHGKGGPGYDYSLSGRTISVKPPVITKFDEDGIIVVEIVVDKSGKVTFAEVNRAKSTNPTFTLCSYARQQAMQTVFNFSTTKGDEQKGTITFKYLHK
jgi:hypothetical protein